MQNASDVTSIRICALPQACLHQADSKQESCLCTTWQVNPHSPHIAGPNLTREGSRTNRRLLSGLDFIGHGSPNTSTALIVMQPALSQMLSRGRGGLHGLDKGFPVARRTRVRDHGGECEACSKLPRVLAFRATPFSPSSESSSSVALVKSVGVGDFHARPILSRAKGTNSCAYTDAHAIPRG